MSKTQYIIEKTDDYILLKDIEYIYEYLQQKWYNYHRCDNCGDFLEKENNHKHNWSVGRSIGVSWSCDKEKIQ